MKKHDLKDGVGNFFSAIKNKFSHSETKQPQALTVEGSNGINPIIVYQMGKVGSKTIEASLHHYFSQNKISVPVYHTHNLVDLDKMEERIRNNKNRPAAQDTIAQLRKDGELRAVIEQNLNQRWCLITLIRDPIAQNVGAFFHNLKEFFPDWREKFEARSLDMQELQKFYIEKYQHLVTRKWFDAQMKPIWDIDVYSAPFDPQKGFAIYSSKRADLLLLRLEDLNSCVAQAFYEFLKFENFEIINQNVGEEKDYKDLYKEFKALPLPSDFVDFMYDTHFMRHFYTEEETRKLKAKWKGED